MEAKLLNEKILNSISNIYALTGLHVCIYDSDLTSVYSNHGIDISDSIKDDCDFDEINHELSSKKICRVALIPSKDIFLYAIKSKSGIFFIGPVAHHELSPFEVHKFKSKYKNIADTLVSCNEQSTFAVLSQLTLVVKNEVMTIHELSGMFCETETSVSNDSNYIDQQIEQIDTFQLNHTIQSENNFFELVKSGDVAGMKQLIATSTFLYPTPIKNLTKNQEYMVVSLVSLLCRAAISANVPANIALVQSDAYLKNISECITEKEIHMVAIDAAITFTELVANSQSVGESSFISARCKKLIHSGLFNPITLSSLASELSVSKEYLATSFKKDYGITVSSYINKKKSELACKILANSDYSINEVASYLSFNSTSYFIKVFKKNIGVTPGDYRSEKNKPPSRLH